MSWEPSPFQRKLLFGATVAVLTGVGIYLTTPEFVGAGDPATPGPSPSPPGAVATPSPGATSPGGGMTTASSTPAPSAVESSARPAYRRAALEFVRAFTDADRPASQWHDDVARHSTANLADGLAYTDPETVPSGTPTGESQVLSTGETGAEIAVALDTGSRIVVTVTSTGDGVAASDVRPGRQR